MATAISHGLYDDAWDEERTELRLMRTINSEPQGDGGPAEDEDEEDEEPLPPAVARALLYHTLLEFAEDEREVADLVVYDGYQEQVRVRSGCRWKREGRGKGRGRAGFANSPLTPISQPDLRAVVRRGRAGESSTSKASQNGRRPPRSRASSSWRSAGHRLS